MQLQRADAFWDRSNLFNLNYNFTEIESVLSSVQDLMRTLVNEGALNQEQFEELEIVLNGLVRKGEMSVGDINYNLGKIEMGHLSDAVIKAIAGNANVNAVPADGSITTVKVADKAINSSKLSDQFSSVRVLEEGENITAIGKEGVYFKNTTSRLVGLPSQLSDGGYGFSGFLIVKPYSQYHYVQEIHDLNNTGIIYSRTVKNNTNVEWKTNSDDVKVQQLANNQVNNKLQYNLNAFEKYTNEVVPEVNLKYANAIQDISIEGVEQGIPVKIWTLSRAFSTWNYRIMIGAKVNGTWSTLLDTGIDFIVEENANGVTNVEYEKNGIKFKARIDYNVIPKNDRLLDHSAMTNDPYFIVRPDKIGTSTSNGGGGGQAYDQTLNTTDNVTFASIKTDALEVTGELQTGTLASPPSNVAKGDMWLDTTDSTTHPIMRVML